MRVTDTTASDQFLKNLKKLTERTTKIQTQVATGNKFETLSDDLNPALKTITLKSQIDRTGSYQKNITNAQSYIETSLTSLTSITDGIQTIISTVTSSDNALEEGNYETLTQSVKDSLSAIVQNINVKSNNMYLFGGTNNSGDIVTTDADGKAVVTTEDISGSVNVQVSKNTKLAINIPGSDIVDTGVFDAINNIIDSLAAGTTPTSDQQSALQDSYKKLLNVESLGGQKSNRLDDINTVLTTNLDTLNTQLTKTQGADTTALSTELENLNYYLELAYTLLGDSFNTNLLDYI
jgi:flagellar hook-associated protein 3 FlgL